MEFAARSWGIRNRDCEEQYEAMRDRRIDSTKNLKNGAIEVSRPNDADRSSFTRKEWNVIRQLNTPLKVQRFLRALAYNWEKGGDTLRTFRAVLRHGNVHCLEAALFAATVLEPHGYPPLLLDLESQDKLDHVLFLFKKNGRYGTVGRSRDAGLHGRKAVFRTIRELVMSYVDPFVDGSGRILAYAVFNLRSLRRCDWRLSTKNVFAVEKTLIHLSHTTLKTSERKYQSALKQYLAFRRKFPDRPATYYQDRHLWM
ncbi:MAG: hypothetical protein ACRD2O_17920 [Terriglobia bacterium]